MQNKGNTEKFQFNTVTAIKSFLFFFSLLLLFIIVIDFLNSLFSSLYCCKPAKIVEQFYRFLNKIFALRQRLKFPERENII